MFQNYLLYTHLINNHISFHIPYYLVVKHLSCSSICGQRVADTLECCAGLTSDGAKWLRPAVFRPQSYRNPTARTILNNHDSESGPTVLLSGG